MLTVVVIAKECLPGRVKTRLHPPLSLEQAATVAAASLADTLDTVGSLPVTHRILACEGKPPPLAESYGFDCISQVDGSLDERLAAIFDACSGPTFLVGMDTPQITAALLDPVLNEWGDDTDAWLGFATDGGFWALGMAQPDGSVIRGVPMSRADTGRIQHDRLRAAGLRVRCLPVLTDVDSVSDAAAVAATVPDSRFAAAFRQATALSASSVS